MEEWRVVAGWEEYYEVSSLGCIRRIKRGKGARHLGLPLKPWLTLGGYQMIYLCRDNTRHPKLLHRLIAGVFLGASALEVNHKDGNKQNNAVTNLEYMTRKQNSADAQDRGCYWRGDRMTRAKLTANKVRLIRRRLLLGQKQKDIAEWFGVTQSTIACIKGNRSWAWVT